MDNLFDKINATGYSSGGIIHELENVFSKVSGSLSMGMYATDYEYNEREKRMQEVFQELRNKMGHENLWLVDEIEALQNEISHDDRLLAYIQGYIDCTAILHSIKII